MKLTKDQVECFEVFGYLLLPGWMADSIEWITDEFEKVLAEHGAASGHDGSRRTVIDPFIDQSERLSALLDDPRIKDIGSSILGGNFNYRSSDGSYYTGNTRWHRDSFGHRYFRQLKIAMYLDKVDHDTGALRVIPGTHYMDDQYTRDLFDCIYPGNEYKHNPYVWKSIPGDKVPCQTLASMPGDVVLFNHNLMHASYGGGTRRRMLAISLTERMAPEDVKGKKQYGQKMLETAGPDRMIHLEQLGGFSD